MVGPTFVGRTNGCLSSDIDTSDVHPGVRREDLTSKANTISVTAEKGEQNSSSVIMEIGMNNFSSALHLESITLWHTQTG